MAFTTAIDEARLAFVGVPALACLAALGTERWHFLLRFLLPLLGLITTLIALQQHVLAIHWN